MTRNIANRLTRLEQRCGDEAGLPRNAAWWVKRLEDWPREYLLTAQGEIPGPERTAEVKADCGQLAARLRAGELGWEEDEDRANWEIAKCLPAEVRNWMAHVDELILRGELPEDVTEWMERP